MDQHRIRVVDLETTGFLPPDHAVCEIGSVDLVALGRHSDGPVGWAVVPTIRSRFVDPLRAIPPETSAVHHIVDEDVAGMATWGEAVSDLLGPPGPIGLLAAHSAKFERLWLTDAVTGGLPWICTYKCALRLWPEAPAHANQVLRYWRRPAGLDRALASVAHRAGPDAYVTAFLLRDLLALASVEQLVAWSGEPALQVRCHIGKQRGLRWSEVDFGFLEWVAVRDFDEDVLFTVRREMARRRQAWAAGQDADGAAA